MAVPVTVLQLQGYGAESPTGFPGPLKGLSIWCVGTPVFSWSRRSPP